jgi:hypothetical protein
MNDLVAAFREGLALVSVAIIEGPDGLRIAVTADDAPLAPQETIRARWWCRRAAEGEYVADAARRTVRSQREQSPEAARIAHGAVLGAARRQGITLLTEEDLIAQAAPVIARLDDEIEKQKRVGALKSVNQSYKQYRLEATQRGERVLPYAKWMMRYKARLMRDIAANMR